MSKRAVLLANLGSPEQPDTASVRAYLNQLLMDPYVIQLPWLMRRLIVSLLVLPSRPTISAKAYQRIWLDEGSPLIVLSQRLKQRLQQKVTMPVAMAMRYGNPSIESQVIALAKHTGISEIVFIPLYPHYADSTVTTSVEQACLAIKKHKLEIKLTVIKPFYDNPKYISALVSRAQPYLNRPYDHILFSYHGLPESHLRKLDKSADNCLENGRCYQKDHEHHQICYLHQVFRTTQDFVTHAGIAKENYSVAFQSRLGRAKWLGPNTEDCLRKLAMSGNKNILVICPAFVTDCLETLEEIAMRGREVFRNSGGETLTLIPCLNDQPEWVDALASWLNTTQ